MQNLGFESLLLANTAAVAEAAEAVKNRKGQRPHKKGLDKYDFLYFLISANTFLPFVSAPSYIFSFDMIFFYKNFLQYDNQNLLFGITKLRRNVVVRFYISINYLVSYKTKFRFINENYKLKIPAIAHLIFFFSRTMT